MARGFQYFSASTQNQAFNAINLFYKEVVGAPLENIRAVRARRPVQVRRAPSREETLRLIKALQAEAGFTIGLVVRLLYGCGLRVAEPLDLRIKDVNVEAATLIIRAGKGDKDQRRKSERKD